MPAEDSPGRDGVAGVRLPDGRLAFVQGVPRDLRAGTPVRVRLPQGEQAGTVYIPPELLFWCDPAAPLGAFLGLGSAAPDPAVAEADAGPGDGAWLLAPEGAPDAATRAAVLNLARADLARLDDPVPEQARIRPGGLS